MDFFSYIKDELNIILNQQQKEAVQAGDRGILLEACPGSGKTTTMVVRIAYLIICKKVAPSHILTLTFSRASARDMEERFKRLFGCLLDRPVHFSTIHSFCYKFLFHCQRKGHLVVPDLLEQIDGRKNKVLRNIYYRLHNEYLGEDELAELSNEISFVKNKLISPTNLKSAFDSFPGIYSEYENFKKENSFIDFDDMLLMVYEILCGKRHLYEDYGQFKYVHVDEVQDTSLVQHKIIEELSRKGNLFMVGDTDQSIYGFRGAEPDFIVNIKEHYSDIKILKLENNYRSTKNLVNLSNKFIKQNTGRHDKDMRTENDDGKEPEVFIVKNPDEQLQKIIQLIRDKKDSLKTAVLFRNNLSGLPVAYKCIENDIPFYIRENYMSFFKHFVIADIFTIFKLATDSSDIESFERIYYKLGAPISKADVENLKSLMDRKKDIFSELFKHFRHKKHMLGHIGRIRGALKKISRTNPYNAFNIIENDLYYNSYLKKSMGALNVYSALKYLATGTKTLNDFKAKLRVLKNGIDNSLNNSGNDSVFLLTLHGSKGLEFDKVIIIDLIEGEFPCESSLEDLIFGNRKAFEEEVRLFYVGVTRAKKVLYLLAPEKSGNRDVSPSRFISQFIATGNRVGFEEGNTIVHKKFGEGVIISRKDDVAVVVFKKSGRRKLSLTACLKSGLITAVN